MDFKSFTVAEVKAAGKTGEFEALVSVFGNVDRQGDRVIRGAFKRAIGEQPPPPVYFAHNWAGMSPQPPIGETLDWSEGRDGLKVKGRLFVDEGDPTEGLARQVYAAMKSRDGRPPALRQFSFAYDVGKAEFVEEDGQQVRELKEIFPVHEVGPCPVGANPDTRLISPAKTLIVDESELDRLADAVAERLVAKAAAADQKPTPVQIPAWRFPPLHATHDGR